MHFLVDHIKAALILTKIGTMKLIIFLLVYAFATLAKAQNLEPVLEKKLTLKTSNLSDVLIKTENNIKAFVDNFDIQLDSGTKFTSAKQVGGTILQPVLKVSVKKCVLFICQNIDLDAEFSLVTTPNKTCDYSYQLIADLQRSSLILTELYSNIITDICINSTTTGGNAQISISLQRAATFHSGIVQAETLKFIQLQTDSLVKSFETVMKLNGVNEVLISKKKD